MKRITVVLPVLAPTLFLRTLAEFAIKTLRANAAEPFDLIVVEAQARNLDPELHPMDWPKEPSLRAGHYTCEPVKIDRYMNFTPPIGGVREINAAVRAAKTEFVLVTGTDVVVPEGWDREMLRPFEERKDCGISTLAAKEPGYVIGTQNPTDLTVEGMFSPFAMFRRGWEYDESYARVYQDSDLVMRMYEAGLRAYRNLRAAVWHLGGVTNARVDTEEHNRILKQDERLFYDRWGRSPLAMFGMIRWGSIVYGREHEAWLRPRGVGV